MFFFSVFFLYIYTTTVYTMCAASSDLFILIWLKNWLATSKSNMLIFLGGKKKSIATLSGSLHMKWARTIC